MDTKTGIVYCITNLINGKCYIGITTKSIDKRFSEHCRPAKTTRSLIKKAIQKYGIENFKVEELEIVPISELFSAEKKWISSLKTNINQGGIGYNQTDGGDGTIGYRFSDEQKQRFSELRVGKKLKPLSLEAKAKLSKAHTGKQLTDEHKLAIGKSQAGKINSPDTRAKMSKARDPLKKPIEQLTENGCVIRSFGSATEAARYLRENGHPKAHKGNIRIALQTDGKIAYGFRWRYVQHFE